MEPQYSIKYNQRGANPEVGRPAVFLTEWTLSTKERSQVETELNLQLVLGQVASPLLATVDMSF